VENSLVVPQKLKMELQYKLEIPLLVMNPREMKTYVYTRICTQIAALFIIVKRLKELNCPTQTNG
jgi:hypothetical protein